MKAYYFCLAFALAASGCSSTKPANQPAPANPSATAPHTVPTTTPVTTRSGKVAAVNLEARFVVIDYSLSSMPAEGRKLGVYRDGQKVAEVKISGPVIGTNTAADILSGTAKVGDTVRED